MGEVAKVSGAPRRTYASPSVRRQARQLGLELEAVKGSGRGGRALLSDLYATVRSRMMEAQAERSCAAVAAIPARMTIPHVTNFEEVDVTDLESLRAAMNGQGRAPEVSLLSFVVCACAAVLKKMPVFNASLDGTNLILKKCINIGIAVDTPDGVKVPVIRNVDQSGALQIAARLCDHVAAAREGSLTETDLAGRSFTICSSGSAGTGFTPIINPPDVAILGLAGVSIQPRWEGEKMVARSILRLCLSWDHRVLDGVAAAKFLVALGESLSALG